MKKQLTVNISISKVWVELVTAITAVLIVLKVINVIDWDWFWIFTPIWGSIGFWILLLDVMMIIVLIGDLFINRGR